jgi:hypothetical protein
MKLGELFFGGLGKDFRRKERVSPASSAAFRPQTSQA